MTKIKYLRETLYLKSYIDMVDFTNKRTAKTEDEVWILEHKSVFTQGKNNNEKPFVKLHNIPTVKSDRGGSITYHGPGQAIIYFLLDLKRLLIGIKKLIYYIEISCIELLALYRIKGYTLHNAPGIYVKQKKIASLGLRVKNGMTYHGIAINVNMNLTPFNYINPCGYKGLKMTQMSTFYEEINTLKVLEEYSKKFLQRINSIK